MEEGSGFFWKYYKRVSENTVIRLRSGDIITGLRTLWNKQEDFLIYSDDSIAGNECHMEYKYAGRCVIIKLTAGSAKL